LDHSSIVSVIAALGFGAFVFGCFVGHVGGKSSSASSGSSGSGGSSASSSSVGSSSTGGSSKASSSSWGVRQEDLWRVEAKVDVLLKHFDLAAQADAAVSQIAQHQLAQHPNLPPEVLALLPHKKIEAIKLMREMSGLGLKDAKDKIDAAIDERRL
jgi:hypothetical protein